MTPSELDVGHGILDAQHDRMLARIAELGRCVEAEDAAACASSLAALWDETVAHFAGEDAMMEEHAYPERTAHRSAHHLFLEDLKALLREVNEQGITPDVASWALHRMPEWVKFHIQANDAPLAQFVARRTAARIVAVARGEEPQTPPRRSDA